MNREALTAALAAWTLLACVSSGRPEGQAPALERVPAEPSVDEPTGDLGAATLVGRVVDDQGVPVTTYQFVAEGGGGSGVLEEVNDLEGRFVIPGLEPGMWTVAVFQESSGRFSGALAVLVPSGGEVEIELVLPRNAVLAGTVVDPQGEGVAAEIVGQVAMPGLPYDTADWYPLGTSDDDGSFRLPALVGVAYLFARAEGFAPSEVTTVTTEPGKDTRGLILRLSPSGAVTVRVLDAAGEPAPGYPVRLSDLEYRYDETRETDAEGRARFEGLQADRFRADVTVWVEIGNSTQTERLCEEGFRLGVGEHREITLRLPTR